MPESSSLLVRPNFHRGLIFGNSVLTVLLLAVVIIDLTYAPMNRDAGAYLTAVRRMNSGDVPYRDFALGYTPLALYYFLLIMSIVPTKLNYTVYIGGLLFVEALSAFAFFLILRKIGILKSFSYFCAILLFFSFLFAEGDFLVLEPFVVLFSILAFLALLNIQARPSAGYAAGCLAGLGFLFKQYGLLIVPCLLIYCLCQNQSVRRRVCACAIVCAGFLVTVGAFFTLFLYEFDLRISQLSKYILGDGYQANAINSADFVFDIAAITPALFSVFIISRLIKSKYSPYIVFNYFSLLMFLTPLFIRQYLHYVILALPWVLGLYALHFSTEGSKILAASRFMQLSFALASLILVYITCGANIRSATYLLEMPRDGQFSDSQLLDRVVPKGSKVAIFAHPSLCFLTNSFVVPEINCQRCGCGFYETIDIGQARELIGCSDYLVSSDIQYSEGPFIRGLFEANLLSFGSFMSEQGFSLNASSNDRLQIWERNPHSRVDM
jgi:hypothetical protein